MMGDLRGYISLAGEGGTFGFCKRKTADEWQTALGGLQAGQHYTINGHRQFTADAQGSWRGDIQGEAPLYVALLPEGQLVLYDEEKISRSEAALRAKPQKIEKKENRVQQVMRTENKKEPVRYRTRLHGESVDDLPALLWPDAAQKLRPYFEKNLPVRLLQTPGWRFVCVQQNLPRCYVGYRTQEDRVCELAWAVQARNAMLPPKGLPGCRYTLCADGQACWLLTKSL